MRVLDLFGGAGGVACGLDRIGAEHVSVEWHEPAAAVAAAAGHRVVVGDVRDHDTLHRAVRMLGGVDLVWASPPCQAWSTAGKRLGAQDERNGWPWTLDALDALGLPPLIAENVTGMLNHSGQHCGDPDRCPACYVDGWLLPELRRRYRHVDVRTIDAADVGVPQHRRRVIFQARNDRPIAWPQLTHDAPDSMLVAMGARQQWRTVREALGIAVLGGGSRGHGLAEWRPRIADRSPSPTVAGAWGGTGALWDASIRPSTTICGTDGVGIGSSASRETISTMIGRRRLTADECATLQDFPDGYPWGAAGAKAEAYRAVGNSVPPAMAAALVEVYL